MTTLGRPATPYGTLYRGMRHVVHIVCTLAAAACFTVPAAAAVKRDFSFPVARTAHPLALDAGLSDPAWQAGKVPDAGPWEDLTTRTAAPHATTAYLLYDDHNLYVAFEAEQRGTPLTATQSTNDSGFGVDDFVAIGLDPGGNGRQAYLFETTPRGVRYEQASENARYRPHWSATAAVDSKSGTWRAVLIIPLAVLRIPPGAHQTWRVNFYRQVAARAEHYTWAFDGVMQDQGAGNWPDFSDARFWAQTAGIALAGTPVRPRPRLDAFALASAGADRTLAQQANGTFAAEPARPAGLDFSVPITQTINGVGTLDPDFSNVEIDQQTVAPQEFRRQVEEYRPFFAQGAAFLNPPQASGASAGSVLGAPGEVFYSPSVGPFDHGIKLEGTYGNQSFAALEFRGYDVTSGNEFDDTAFGYEHALPDRTFLYWADGVLAHHSIAGDDATVETGFGGRNNKTGFVWTFNHDFENGSWVPQGSANQTNGFLDVHKPNYEILAGYVDMSPNYNPIDGYTANSDLHGFETFETVNGSAKGVKNWSVFFGADRFFDDSGFVHQADTQVGLNALFKNGFSIDGAGPNVGLLREYGVPAGPGCTGAIVAQTYFTGYPCYRDGVTNRFNLMTIPIGYGDGTPTPVDASVAWGPYGTSYQHLYTIDTTHPFGRKLTIGLEYDGSYQRSFTGGELDSQWLRRVGIGYQLTPDSTLTFSLRDINGAGGFSTQQGLNFSAGYAARLHGGDELYVNWGSPAAATTLDRFIVKFVFHAGAESGT